MNTIISKLEQDDKILAELDNQLRSVSRTSTTGPATETKISTASAAAATNRDYCRNLTPTSFSGNNKNHDRSSPINIIGKNRHNSSGLESIEKPIRSLPSLNSDDVHEWKYQDYQSILNTDHQQHKDCRNENEPSISRKDSCTSLTISNELKRLEERIAAARGEGCSKQLSSTNDHHRHHHHHQSGITIPSSNDRKTNLKTQEHGIGDDPDLQLLDKQLKPLVSNKGSTRIESLSASNEKKFRFDKKPASNLSSKDLTKDLDMLMEKLERDNKILAELDKKLKTVSKTGLESSLLVDQPPLLSSSLPSYTTTDLPKTSTLVDYHHISKSSNPLNPNNSSSAALYSAQRPSSILPAPISSNTVGRTQLSLPALPQTQPYRSTRQIDELKEAEEIVDSIELPNRGRCRVFMARYNYDPYKHSPNENPETEVTLMAGDFILVFSNIDEDGYYYGELLDGRRGLVPSNFIEKLTGDDLFEFQARVLYGHNKEAESDTASFPPEFYDAILNEQIGHTSFQHLLAPDDFHRINDYIDLEDATEIDEDVSEPERAEQEAAKTTVPPPQRLIVERQLHKSVLIGWLPPECPRTMIDHYQIYVDGVLKATIPSGDRTKALVEGVDSSMPHRISIRAIDRHGRHSKDPGCTIVIGKNIPFAPCCVKASNITSDSALISWIPCNSNFYHVVAVNSVEVRTVKPSVFKHLIVGLSANTLYRVSVRAKPGKLLCSDEKNPKKLEMLTTFVDFRTLPKSLPDPPVDIQIEAGPQEGTLLVTWLPITLNQLGTSNNCPVTGYAVFAGHKKLAEIDSPTGDHALLDIASLEHLHKKQITVRTKSGENLSQDSMPCQIPDDLLKLQTMHNNPNQPSKRTQIQSDSESDTDLNRLMHNVARRSKEFEMIVSSQPHHSHQEQKSCNNQNTPYDMRQRITNRSSQVPGAANRTIGGRMIGNRPGTNVHSSTIPMNDHMARMNIPAIEITKETPISESVQPVESYSEEEFDQSMKQRVYGGKRSGVSPMPPQRTRVLSEYERSNLGPYNQMSTHRRPQNQHGVRWFVALFDYDPMTMSPNPDAAEEELPFQEGQLIKIYGDKDADGFYRGECNGRIGYVPCNMVSEVQYDVENDPRFRNNPNDPLSHLPIRKMIALYDYDPQELSPNFDTETELAFRTGDIIYVYGDMDEDGFYIGEANGMRGLVPSNFLADAGPVEPTNVRHTKLMSGTQPGQLQTRQMNPSNTMAMGQIPGQVMPTTGMQMGQMQTLAGTMQQPMSQQQQQFNQTMQQFNQQPTTMQNFNTSQATVAGLYPNTMQATQQPTQQQQQMLLQQTTNQQMMQPQQQQQQQPFQQQQSGTTTNQMMTAGVNQPQQQQMFQTAPQQQSGTFQQPTQSGQLQQPHTQQQQQQQPPNPMQQTSQSMARVMRQQNPMSNVVGGHQQQGQYNPMFQGIGTNIGNKQRPNSLDLNIGTPRFGQQIINQGSSFGGPMPGPGQPTGQQLQLPNQQQQSQQQQQQQQSTGMLGSLFASGKKMLEEATTPLGARGPYAHPNQPHQPMMGHHTAQQPGTIQPGQLPMQTNPTMAQQSQQQPQQLPGQMNFGQSQPQQQQQQQGFNPMMAGQANQQGQPAGTILNTMKNIFKL